MAGDSCYSTRIKALGKRSKFSFAIFATVIIALVTFCKIWQIEYDKYNIKYDWLVDTVHSTIVTEIEHQKYAVNTLNAFLSLSCPGDLPWYNCSESADAFVKAQNAVEKRSIFEPTLFPVPCKTFLSNKAYSEPSLIEIFSGTCDRKIASGYTNFSSSLTNWLYTSVPTHSKVKSENHLLVIGEHNWTDTVLRAIGGVQSEIKTSLEISLRDGERVSTMHFFIDGRNIIHKELGPLNNTEFLQQRHKFFPGSNSSSCAVFELTFYSNHETENYLTVEAFTTAGQVAVLLGIFITLLYWLENHSQYIIGDLNAKIEAKRVFMRFISHEIRTPLNTGKLFSVFYFVQQ